MKKTIYDVVSLLFEQTGTIKKMFALFKKRRRFGGLSAQACSLITILLERGDTLYRDGAFARVGLRAESDDFFPLALIDELQSYSLIESVGGAGYAPTKRARKNQSKLRDLDDAYLALRTPEIIRLLLTDAAIQPGAPVWLEFQKNADRIAIGTTYRTKNETVVRKHTVFCGYGELVSFLSCERLVTNWKAWKVNYAFGAGLTDEFITTLLNDAGREPLTGKFTERAARLAAKLNKQNALNKENQQ